jgi:catechol 2,3-dioxygenase-like lactoylglutathione lyase family enzyme
MKLEHFALNVPDAPAHAAWYVTHLGMTIASRCDVAPYTHFLTDGAGHTLIELYSKPGTEYATAHPQCYHLAVVAGDARAECARLKQAGAAPSSEISRADGTLLIMMLDPWGVAIQLCQRPKPFVMP